jgi:hypothetical protein
MLPYAATEAMKLSKMTQLARSVGVLAATLATACARTPAVSPQLSTADAASALIDAASAATTSDSQAHSVAGSAAVIEIITGVAPIMLDAGAAARSDPEAVPPAATVVTDASVNPSGSETTAPIEDFPARFDPDRVYVIGRRPEAVSGDLYAFQLAPIDALDRAAFSLPGFASPVIRRTDRRLLYDFNGGWELREWRADSVSAMSTGELISGEPVVEAAALPCGPIDRYSTRRYLVAWDGSVYHSCPGSDASPPQSSQYVESWYDPTGALAYTGPSVTSIGPEGRALVWLDDGSSLIVDFLRNQTLKQLDLPNRVTPSSMNAARAYAQGFRFAFTTARGREWTDVNLAGELQAAGVYPGLPTGVTINESFWGRSWSALDGAGTLYEFAQLGEEKVIVQRPRQGASVLVCTSHDYGWWGLDELFSGY